MTRINIHRCVGGVCTTSVNATSFFFDKLAWILRWVHMFMLVKVNACHSNVKKKTDDPVVSHRRACFSLLKPWRCFRWKQSDRWVRRCKWEGERQANLHIWAGCVFPQLLACFVYIISPHHRRNQRSHSVFYFSAFFVPVVPFKKTFGFRPDRILHTLYPD